MFFYCLTLQRVNASSLSAKDIRGGEKKADKERRRDKEMRELKITGRDGEKEGEERRRKKKHTEGEGEDTYRDRRRSKIQTDR